VLVQHTPSDEYFALKMLTISEVLKLKQVDHVKNEKEVLSTVRHPFIVDMYVIASTPLDLSRRKPGRTKCQRPGSRFTKYLVIIL